jgi:hypothetical protein
MNSISQENLDFETDIRDIAARIPGARVYRDDVDQPHEIGLNSSEEEHSSLGEHSSSKEVDQARLDKYIGAMGYNVTLPTNIDLLKS